MAATPARLRHDIDSGKTGDKVRAPDPAMAPLGTDDEAAGTSLRTEDIEAARAHELHPSLHGADESHASWLAVAGVAAVFGIALLSAAVLR